jgi:hypothetical protein
MNVISTPRADDHGASAQRPAGMAGFDRVVVKVDAHHRLVLPVVPTGAYTQLTAE